MSNDLSRFKDNSSVLDLASILFHTHVDLGEYPWIGSTTCSGFFEMFARELWQPSRNLFCRTMNSSSKS